MEQQGIQNVLRCLPQQVRSRIQQLTPSEQAQIQEIRLRAERPACILLHSREKPLDPGHPVSQRTIEQTFQAVCEYSVYRYAKEIAEGFVTIAGGNRVGIAGSAVYREGKLVQMRHISGLNFRVSHAVTGCAEPLFRQICPERPSSLLLAGAVGSGKQCSVTFAAFWGHPGGSHWWMSAARSPPYTTACRSMMWDCTPMCWTAFHGQRVC